MKKAVIYIHGKGGNAGEAEHYRSFFPDSDVIGFDYVSQFPWDAQIEFQKYFQGIKKKYDNVTVIANSIGAYFALVSLSEVKISKAFFISPIVNMEKLIQDMLCWSGETEESLKEKGEIPTDFGETLSWNYLSWVRSHPINWKIPTDILYGEKDNMQSLDTIWEFEAKTDSIVTIMENGEHWFHTMEQMKFLDLWIQNHMQK